MLKEEEEEKNEKSSWIQLRSDMRITNVCIDDVDNVVLITKYKHLKFSNYTSLISVCI